MQKNYILADSSRRTIDLAVEKVLGDKSLIEMMLSIAFGKDKPLAQRASRVIFRCAEKDNRLIAELSATIINRLDEITNDSVKANFLSIYSECFLPEDEDLVGILADDCFKSLNGISDREGLKICSMEILYKVSNIYPEIKNELLLNIENLMQHNKMAFQSRGKKILEKLNKEINTKLK